MKPALFAGLLGPAWSGLPNAVRQLHAGDGPSHWQGEVDVQRAHGRLAALCAALTGLPPSMPGAPITVRFERAPDAEHWHREFAGHDMQSRLWRHGNYLAERLGAVSFRFRLGVDDGALSWRVHAVRLFGCLPLPARWFEGVYCRESERDGRYRFLAVAALPGLGELIRYEGWLEPAQ